MLKLALVASIGFAVVLPAGARGTDSIAVRVDAPPLAVRATVTTEGTVLSVDPVARTFRLRTGPPDGAIVLDTRRFATAPLEPVREELVVQWDDAARFEWLGPVALPTSIPARGGPVAPPQPLPIASPSDVFVGGEVRIESRDPAEGGALVASVVRLSPRPDAPSQAATAPNGR